MRERRLRIRYSQFLITLFLIQSCSSLKKLKHDWFESDVEHLLTSVKKSPQVINYGPDGDSNHFTFKDVTSKVGLESVEATNFYWVDINLDNINDLVVLPSDNSSPHYYIFDSQKSIFIKQGELLDQTIKASYLLFYDFDGDRVDDLIVGVMNQRSELSSSSLRLFKGSKNKERLSFELVPDAFDLGPLPSSTAMPIDFDLDGDLDLFVGNWFSQKKNYPELVPDMLLENNGGRFSDKSSILTNEGRKSKDQNVYLNARPTYAAAICDIDQNGFPDIATASTNGYANKLWMNISQTRKTNRLFKDYGVDSFYSGDTRGRIVKRGDGRTFATSCFDYNQDGIMDFFLGELYHNYDNENVDQSSILTGRTYNFPPKFIRTEYVLDSQDIEWHQADRKGLWFDYNNDGRVDLLIDNSGFPPHSRTILFEQLADRSLLNVSKKVGINIVNPLNSIVLDYNDDGKLDILSAQSDVRDARIKKRVYLFENQTQQKATILKFYFDGQFSNKRGVGNFIKLFILRDGEKLTMSSPYQLTHGGMPSQSNRSVQFALRDNDQVGRVELNWSFSKDKKQFQGGYQYKIPPLKKNNVYHFTLCENGLILSKAWGDCP